MPREPRQPATRLLQGTLDMIVLDVLRRGELHGYDIVQQIMKRSGEVLLVEEGSLYPALHRLEKRGHIKGDWRASQNNRRARYYGLTPKGRRQLKSEQDEWRNISGAINRVMGLNAGGLAAGGTAS